MHINTGCPTKHDESRLWFLNFFGQPSFTCMTTLTTKLSQFKIVEIWTKLILSVFYIDREHKKADQILKCLDQGYFLSINYTEFYLKFATVMYRGTTFTRELRKVSNLQNSFKGTVFNFGFHNISLTMGLINWMII